MPEHADGCRPDLVAHVCAIAADLGDVGTGRKHQTQNEPVPYLFGEPLNVLGIAGPVSVSRFYLNRNDPTFWSLNHGINLMDTLVGTEMTQRVSHTQSL